MAPPWVKSQGAPTTVVSSTPWGNGPGRLTQQPSPLPNAPPAPSIGPRPQMPQKSFNPPPPRSPTSPGSAEQPRSLAALLQQAPLRALSPSINEDTHCTAPSGGGKPPPQLLKGPRIPEPQGPLAGAKFVLPPLPPPMKLKAVSAKNPVRLAKIAKLRQSVNPPLEDNKMLLREIEAGIKLNHGSCNDRSKPLIGPCQTFFPNF